MSKGCDCSHLNVSYGILSSDLSYPAHLAAYSGDLEHLQNLVEKGVSNINEQDEKGSTAAHKGMVKNESFQWINTGSSHKLLE